VVIHFNDEGTKLFGEITAQNVGKQLAIFLDGVSISEPVIQEAITGGTATITGKFTPTEGRDLVRNLNFGALPVPIELASSNTAGPSLGASAFTSGLTASAIGFLLVALFMILWYRLPGIMASLALASYLAIMLALFKIIPVTLTASGIAGLIISLGLAVDANVLTFERMKEEIAKGKGLKEGVEAGFVRAWTSIRDSHIAAIIVAIILFWLGSSIVKGFAFTFFLGAVVSLFSAQIITRVFLRAIVIEKAGDVGRFLFGSGIGN
jgi:protein-export membrane protein SecD